MYTSFRQWRCRGSWWIWSRRTFIRRIGAERSVEWRPRLGLIETKLFGQLLMIMAVYVFEYTAACHLHLPPSAETATIIHRVNLGLYLNPQWKVTLINVTIMQMCELYFYAHQHSLKHFVSAALHFWLLLTVTLCSRETVIKSFLRHMHSTITS